MPYATNIFEQNLLQIYFAKTRASQTSNESMMEGSNLSCYG